MEKLVAGRLAEEAAARYLAVQGYRIRERNHRTALGEIDIIAEDGSCLVFVEVRSRLGSRMGRPEETVNWVKQQKLRKLAGQYLQSSKEWQRQCRFDVIGVLLDGNGEVKSLELIRDAF